MIVADTGAAFALIDETDRYHRTIVELYEDSGANWILPWAILPEVDYLVGRFLGRMPRGTG